MKSRSSTGVGMKIDLEYNIDTMRITDSGADDDSTQYKRPASTMLDNIRNKSTVNSANSDSESNLPKITADVQSNKLKQMLANLKTPR
jgi:hypothetical protein